MLKKITNIFKKEKVKIQNPTFEKKTIVFDEIATKVLDENQILLKDLLSDLSTTHFLAGGTAVALYLGHRKSIDFDFFSEKAGSFADFVNRISKYGLSVSEEDKLFFRGQEFVENNEIHLNVNNVKISLINFFRVLYDNQKICIKGNSYLFGGLRIANLEELLAMKLFAMITRNKWKDAVDLYFLLDKLKLDLSQALEIAENKYFINIFNKEAVLEQLISENWDTSEKVEYIIENPPKDEKIISYLSQEAIKIIN